MISEADPGLISLTDSPAEARNLILASAREHPGSAGYGEQAREATHKALGKPTYPPNRSEPEA